MGMFGQSKGELKEEIAQLKIQLNDQNSELNAEMNKMREKFRAQEAKFKEIGALEHLERVSLYQKLEHDLDTLRKTADSEKLAIDKERNEKIRVINAELEDRKARANAEFERFKSEINGTLANRRDLLAKENAKLANLKKEVINLEDSATLQSLGFYSYESPAEKSVELSDELTKVRNRIKEMLKDNSAAHVSSNFFFDNSAAKGKRFANDMRKLMLKAYNAEAENAIKSVKAGNQELAIARLAKTKEMAEKLGNFIELSISQEFHSLRVTEINLANRHLVAIQHERELERERRAELKEAEKVEAEIRKERAKKEAERKKVQRELEEAQKALEDKKRMLLEKERDHYGNVISSLDSIQADSLDADSVNDLQADEETLQRIQEKFDDANRAIEDLDYREANTKAGYVYVLSNIGAFGEDVVKIGMTRRLDPSERVKELSGAAVPFVFDTHLMVFSNDARGLEHNLHKHFSSVRVNRINQRKEYFKTTPENVLEVLKEMDVAVVEFTKEAEASDYRAGLLT